MNNISYVVVQNKTREETQINTVQYLKQLFVLSSSYEVKVMINDCPCKNGSSGGFEFWSTISHGKDFECVNYLPSLD